MYLHVSVICLRRYSFDNWYICNSLIFAIVDTLFQSIISATCFSLNLQMLFSPPVMYKLHLHLAFSSTWGYFLHKFCIYIPHFLWPKDASHWNHASATCFFYNLQILLIKIFHLQSPKIRHRRYFHSISFKFYLVHDDLQARKDYALLLSFVGQARLQFAGVHSLFLLGGVPWLK